MKDFKVQTSNLWAFIAGILIFLISLYIEPKYIYGDQEHYREFFNYCFYDGYSHAMQLFCYQNTLGSTEPGYFYLSKIAQLFLEKDIYISFANAILVFLLIKVVFKWYEKIWHRYFFIFLVITNYYLIVLMFAAERLKFSFIFLVLALLVAKQWQRIIVFGLALFTHVQSALLIATFFISKVLDKDTKLWVKIIISIICIVGFAGAFLVMQEHIINKLGAYSEGTEEEGNGFISMIKTGIFIFLAGVSTFRLLPIVSGIPLVLLSYFLGSERIGMLAFILYVCAVIYYKKKADLLLFLVMLYFTLKTPSFILNILNYGVGYVSNG